MKKAPHTPVQQLEHEADLGLQPAGRRQQQQRRHIARRHPALAARQQRRRRSRLGRRCGRLVASGEGEQHFNPRDALRRAFASTPPRQCKWSGHGQALLGTQWHSLSNAAASATAPRRKPAWGSAMRSAGNRGTNEGAEKHVWSTRLPGGFQDFQDSQRISRRFPEDFQEISGRFPGDFQERAHHHGVAGETHVLQQRGDARLQQRLRQRPGRQPLLVSGPLGVNACIGASGQL